MRTACDPLAALAGSPAPAPPLNARILSDEVDVLWPPERVIVELDGIAAHGRPRAFQADRRRDQRPRAAGYVVVRVTFRQLVDEPLAVLARVAQALAIAAARSPHPPRLAS